METDLIVNHRRRMPELDDLAQEEKDARFRRIATKALAQYGLEPEELTFLFHSDGITYKVEAKNTSNAYLLRIHTNVGAHFSELFYKRAGIQSPLIWQSALSEQTSLTVQIPVRTVSDELISEVQNDSQGDSPFLCTLVTWVPGSERDLESRDQARELGKITGIMHRHAVSWESPSGFLRAEWDASQTFGYLHELRPYVKQGGRVSPTVYSLAERACEKVAKMMTDIPKTKTTWGLIHGELGWFGNCIYQDGIGTPIDFNGCAFGHYMHDLAKLIWWVREDFRQDILDAYREQMSLPDDYLEQLLTFYMAEMMFRTGTRAQVDLDIIMPDTAEGQLTAGLRGEHDFLFEPP